MSPANMSRGPLVVGHEHCTIASVLRVLNDSGYLHLMVAKFRPIASELNIPSADTERWMKELTLNTLDDFGIVYNLVSHWRSRIGSKAFLKTLLDILDKHGLKTCSESLENAFQKEDVGDARFKIKKYTKIFTTTIVGNGGCPVSRVVFLMQNSQYFLEILQKLHDIAFDMNTKKELIKKIQKDNFTNTTKTIALITDVLQDWVDRNGQGATLQELVTILDTNELDACVESILKGIENDALTAATPPAEKHTTDVKKLSTIFRTVKDSNPKYCILRTIQEESLSKIKEAVEYFLYTDWQTFEEVVTGNFSTPNQNQVVVVTECLYNSFAALNQVLKNGILVFVTDEDNLALKALFEKWARGNHNLHLEFRPGSIGKDNNRSSCGHLKFSWNCLKTYQIKFMDKESNANQESENCSNLQNTTLLKFPNFYLERTLLSRNYVSVKMLEDKSDDIFLFTGLEMSQFSNLLSTKYTDTTTRQLANPVVSVKFMLQDHPGHFEKICQVCPSNSIHLLDYTSETLRWIKSSGNLKMIQKYIHPNQETLSEHDFLKKMRLHSNHAVVISGRSGMGKSVLLKQISKKLQSDYPERIVCLTPFSNFYRVLKQIKSKESNNTEVVMKTLIEVLNQIEEDNEILNSKLNSKEISVELLIDDLYHDITYFFRTILLYKSIRLWITSKPHFLEPLEANLDVLGYKIEPFDDNKQTRLLSLYLGHGSFARYTNIEAFALHCLQLLKFWTNPYDRGVVGNPTNGVLVRQILETTVSTKIDYDNVQFNLNRFPPIIDLYKLLIANKFEHYFNDCQNDSNYNNTQLMKMHARFSLKLILPEYEKKFDNLLCPVDEQVLLNIGIVESRSIKEVLKLTQSNFAEYFVAWFVVEMLKSINDWNEDLTTFLFETILHCKPCPLGSTINHDLRFTNMPCQIQTSEYYTFTNKMLASFLEYFLNESSKAVWSSNIVESLQRKCLKFEAGTKILFACSFHNFVNIFRFLNSLNFFKHSDTIVTERCILIAVCNAELEIIKFILERYEQQHNLPLNTDIQKVILHCAFARGSFSIVEFLIKEKGLRSILKQANFARELLCAYVQDVTKQSFAGKQERDQLMWMLVGITREMSDESQEQIVSSNN